MVVENAPARHRGLLGSMVQIGNPIGVLAAVGIFALVSKLGDEKLMSWGWRIPFLISILLVGVGLYIRLSLAEAPVFRPKWRPDTGHCCVTNDTEWRRHLANFGLRLCLHHACSYYRSPGNLPEGTHLRADIPRRPATPSTRPTSANGMVRPCSYPASD